MSIKIGFSNLDEQNVFAREMREQLELAVSKRNDMQLVWRDNRHDTEQAIANVKEFVSLGVDIAIIYHIDERAGINVTMPLRLKRIPIIAVEFQLPLAVSIGIDNGMAGKMSGRVGGKWIRNNWSGKLDRIVIFTDQRVISTHRERFLTALAAIEDETLLKNPEPLWVDSSTEAHVAAERFAELLQIWKEQHHIAVITMGDVVSQGILDVARSLGREEDIALMSFDGTGWAGDELKKPSNHLIVSPYFNLEHYCQVMLDLALSMLEGKTVPQYTSIQPILLARD